MVMQMTFNPSDIGSNPIGLIFMVKLKYTIYLNIKYIIQVIKKALY